MEPNSNPVATLSMYDWPETAPYLDRLWHGIAKNLIAAGINAPSNLNRDREPSDLWTSPELLIGQTCGWPYANHLRGKVVPFARFDHGITGCPPGHYNSVFVGRNKAAEHLLKDQESLMLAERIAINGDDSQSGFHVWQEITGGTSQDMLPHAKRLITGSHRNSVLAVAQGDAEVAAIDAIAFELAGRHEQVAASSVCVIGRSKPKPGLPLITSPARKNQIPALYEAIETAIREVDTEVTEALLIQGLVPASDTEYDQFA